MAPVRRSASTSRRSTRRPREKLHATIVDRGYHQGPVEKVVVLFARGLGDQQAAMARCPVQEAGCMLVLRLVLGAHGVIGTQLSHLQCRPHMVMDTAANLN